MIELIFLLSGTNNALHEPGHAEKLEQDDLGESKDQVDHPEGAGGFANSGADALGRGAG